MSNILAHSRKSWLELHLTSLHCLLYTILSLFNRSNSVVQIFFPWAVEPLLFSDWSVMFLDSQAVCISRTLKIRISSTFFDVYSFTHRSVLVTLAVCRSYYCEFIFQIRFIINVTGLLIICLWCVCLNQYSSPQTVLIMQVILRWEALWNERPAKRLVMWWGIFFGSPSSRSQ